MIWAGFSGTEVPKGLPAKHANTPFISRSSADPSCKDEGWSNDKELRQSLYWVALLWVQAHSCYCSIYNISTMCSDANDMSRCNWYFLPSQLKAHKRTLEESRALKVHASSSKQAACKMKRQDLAFLKQLTTPTQVINAENLSPSTDQTHQHTKQYSCHRLPPNSNALGNMTML